MRERESGCRYTPTTCYETFPFPELSDTSRAAIGDAAKALDDLNPPEWVIEDVLEFPASVNGPWGHMVTTPNVDGIGTAHYVRLLARDEEIEKKLEQRTLTNLYNERPAWLADAHRRLDEAVFAAYGWSPDIADEDLLARLLELNLARAGTGGGLLAGAVDDADSDVDDQ